MMKTMTSKSTELSGIWIIDKPVGPTSHDIVSFIRSRSKITRVGHTGTLDPQASGVLVICTGKATRLIEYLENDKEYRAEISLGRTTDTYDAAGKTLLERPVPELTLAQVEEACVGFRGKIQQIPPMVSAKRFQGQRLYELARQGKEVERKPVEVSIQKFEIVDFASPVIKVLVVCSAGMYVRTLAHDLGEKLGCGAHLKSLTRTRVGAFGIERSLTLPAWEQAWNTDKAAAAMVPMHQAVAHLPSISVAREKARIAVAGKPLIFTDEECLSLAGVDFFDPPFVALLFPDNTLFAIAKPRRKIRGWIVKVEKIFQNEF